ncbi:MAG: hypothetical protein H6R10_1810 [Rhodocyclaceae bacterium]|nr:hypothetical protein [Rhodocyclaceae bacterium]
MNANKGVWTLLAAVAATLSMGAHAVQGLDAHGQTKVNNALAKQWQQRDAAAKSQNRQVVNVGSKRGGDCNVNVGTAQAGKGGRQPKDIVVTTKEVINVCK